MVSCAALAQGGLRFKNDSFQTTSKRLVIF